MRLHGEEIQLSIWVVDHDGKDSEFPFAISILVTVAVLSQMFVTKTVGLSRSHESGLMLRRCLRFNSGFLVPPISFNPTVEPRYPIQSYCTPADPVKPLESWTHPVFRLSSEVFKF